MEQKEISSMMKQIEECQKAMDQIKPKACVKADRLRKEMETIGEEEKSAYYNAKNDRYYSKHIEEYPFFKNTTNKKMQAVIEADRYKLDMEAKAPGQVMNIAPSVLEAIAKNEKDQILSLMIKIHEIAEKTQKDYEKVLRAKDEAANLIYAVDPTKMPNFAFDESYLIYGNIARMIDELKNTEAYREASEFRKNIEKGRN